jgi:hypothetical protein
MEVTEFALWIADLTNDAEGRAALRDGRSLTDRARLEEQIAAESGPEDLARVFAQAWSDGWITFDFEGWPNDPEPPKKFAFRHHHLQRCRDIRIARDAWPAIPALRAEAGHSPGAVGGGPERDLFICHAGEDKDAIARPLAERLRDAGRKVWYDEFEIRLGDGLRSKIDEGLNISRFGVVILSQAFLAKKPWTERELDGLTTREVTEGAVKVILPIWHEVGHAEVAAYSPTLADRHAASTADGLDAVIAEIEAVLGPEGPDPSPTMSTAVTNGNATPESQPFHVRQSEQTPLELYDEVLTLVRAKDEIGLAELMRLERRRFADGLDTAISAHRQEYPDDEKLLKTHDALLPIFERRFASLLPLIAYAPNDFNREVRSLIDFLEVQPLEGGYRAWSELADWASWWLSYACGAFALSVEAWVPLGVLFDAMFTSPRGNQRFLLEPVRESVGADLGRVVMARFSESRWLVPRWEHLVWSLRESQVISKRWPEFLQEDSPRSALNNFDFLVSIRRGFDGSRPPLAHWGMSYDGAVAIARKLQADESYRQSVAPLLDVESSELIERAGEVLKGIEVPQGCESSAIGVLVGDRPG